MKKVAPDAPPVSNPGETPLPAADGEILRLCTLPSLAPEASILYSSVFLAKCAKEGTLEESALPNPFSW